MAVRNVEYIIGLRDRFSKGINKINSKAFQLDNKMKQLDKSTSGFGKTLGRVFAGVVILGGIKKTIDAFEKQEFAIAQVRQGIASTGGVAKKTLSELTAGAKKLQGETIFGDETILQNVTAQILTFTNVTGESFDRTQQAVLDVTTRLFGARASAESLRSTSIQLGKALNDPIRNLGALSRSGITFSQSQIDVIKSLAETGKLAEAQAIILGELERQYGGSAKAARDTAFGGIKVLQSQFQDLLVIIGEQFIPIILSTKDTLQGLIGFFTENTKVIAILVKLTIAAVTAFVAYKVVTLVLTGAIRAYVVIVKITTIVTRLLTRGTKSATTAMKIFGLAVKTTPIGLIATLLSVAAGAFLFFRDDMKKANDELTKFGNKIDEISAKIGRATFKQLAERLFPGIEDLSFIPNIAPQLAKIAKDLTLSELESLKLFFQETEGSLKRAIANAATEATRIRKTTDLDRIVNSLKIVNEELAKFGKAGVRFGGITTKQIGVTKITSAAPKIFNINIEKLVDTINNNVTNLKEGMNDSKKIVVEALLGALNDTQALVR